jgi:hypothetical protein
MDGFEEKQGKKDSSVLKHFEIRTILCFQQLPILGLDCFAFEVREITYTVLLTQHYSSDKIDKSEMGGACNTYLGQERCIQDFGGKTWKTQV